MKYPDFLKFHQVGKAKVVPVTFKIVLVLTLFIIISNITTNYISLTFGRINQINSTREILTKDLRAISNFSNTQWQIYQLNQDKEKAIGDIRKKGRYEIKNASSVVLGFDPENNVVFSTLDKNNDVIFDISKALEESKGDLTKAQTHFISLKIDEQDYFGVVRYNEHWKMYLFRGEQEEAYYSESWQNFRWIILFIFLITVISTVSASYIVRHILRYISVITDAIMDMTNKQKLTPIALGKASNDDVTYLGMSFNVLSHNMDRLVNIFTKFADRDIVEKVYKEKEIRLEGEKQNLTMLFTDIQGYTNMTETLGTDIIKLLNIQYGYAIDKIDVHHGTVASIIGDALLAVYGVLLTQRNKSYLALLSAYEIIEATDTLKLDMQEKRARHIEQHQSLSEDEEKIYQAVLLNVGVGIDCGDVFYGTIGSNLRMTTTVIGDSVNSAARLEGLTRIYKIPVICSQSVVDDIQSQVDFIQFEFIHIDRVQVKGKDEFIPIYWPIPLAEYNSELKAQIALFQQGLALYYQGEWLDANRYFSQCALPLADIFIDRTTGQCPDGWEGVWTMTSK